MSSITDEVHRELKRTTPHHLGCRRAQLVTYLRMAAELRMRRGGMVLVVNTESEETARYLRREIQAVFDIPVGAFVLPDGRGFEVSVTGGAQALATAAGLLDRQGNEAVGLPARVVGGTPGEVAAAWRGAFLAAGRLRGAEKKATLDVVCPTPEIAYSLTSCARRLGVMGVVRSVNGTEVVRVSEADSIATLLTRMDAQASLTEWNHRTARRRMQSWDSLTAANSRRREKASNENCARVRRALAVLGGEAPQQLAEAGRLRLRYPDASLEELGRYASPPMTKDAVAGKLRRLMLLADKAPAAAAASEPSGRELADVTV